MRGIGWLDASSGISGDMVLGALLDAGVPPQVLDDAIDAVAPESIETHIERVQRHGFAATRCIVSVADSVTARTLGDIERLLDAAALDTGVRMLAKQIFGRLARAEATVHGTGVDQVHFHEVGALDAIADVVGAAAGFVHLGLEQVVCSPVALGAGTVTAAHGTLAVPAPAVVELLRGVPTYGGPIDLELTTPTGAAILASVATGFGPQPAMVVERTGIGAGGADPAGHTNVLRLFVGQVVAAQAPAATTDAGALVIEANVDDLDPRLWPDVIAALLAAGASDAWLTPILMKKGRPAQMLSALVGPDAAAAVRREVFRQTSTIGIREHSFAKHALDRSFVEVEVGGSRIAVKLAHLDGELMNLQPEYADVAAAAVALDRPVKDVLAEAAALARALTS